MTLTAPERTEIFGHLSAGQAQLNSLGEIVLDEWLRTPRVRPGVEPGEFIIMPDHMHGIIVIREERNGVPRSSNNLVGGVLLYTRRVTPFRSPSGTLGAVIRGFKGATTKRINEVRSKPGEKVWQRNYYEHVVRDERDLRRIQHYIRENPVRSAEERELRISG